MWKTAPLDSGASWQKRRKPFKKVLGVLLGCCQLLCRINHTCMLQQRIPQWQFVHQVCTCGLKIPPHIGIEFLDSLRPQVVFLRVPYHLPCFIPSRQIFVLLLLGPFLKWNLSELFPKDRGWGHEPREETLQQLGERAMKFLDQRLFSLQLDKNPIIHLQQLTEKHSAELVCWRSEEVEDSFQLLGGHSDGMILIH